MSAELIRGGGRGARVRAWAHGLCAALVLLAGAAVLAPKAATAFTLGLQDQSIGQPGAAPSARNTDATMRTEAISSVRISVHWSAVAPDTATRPSGFHAGDPADSALSVGRRWTRPFGRPSPSTDRCCSTSTAPRRGRRDRTGPTSPSILPGAWDPQVAEFSAFARAAAMRYSGTFTDASGRPPAARQPVGDLERGEPPLVPGRPQPGRRVPGAHQRRLHRDHGGPPQQHDRDGRSGTGVVPATALMAPLKFAAALMCLRRSGTAFVRIPRCQKARFDVFAHHPTRWRPRPPSTPIATTTSSSPTWPRSRPSCTPPIASARCFPRFATRSGSPSSPGTPIRPTGPLATQRPLQPAMSPIPCTRCGTPG